MYELKSNTGVLVTYEDTETASSITLDIVTSPISPTFQVNTPFSVCKRFTYNGVSMPIYGNERLYYQELCKIAELSPRSRSRLTRLLKHYKKEFEKT